MADRIPLSSATIPTGTGLVQQVECKGIRREDRDGPTFEPLTMAVTAEIATFANGIRRVSCLHALDSLRNGNAYCNAGTRGRMMKCIYAWGDLDKK